MKLPFSDKKGLLYSDIFELTFQRLKSKILRTFLTVFGISIGISVVYVLVALTFGLQNLVIKQITTSDSLLTLDVLPNQEINDLIKLDNQTVSKLSSLEKIEVVSPVKSLAANLEYNGLKTQTIAYGVTENYFRLAAVNAQAGSVFKDDEPNQIVVSSAVLNLFDLSIQDAIGSKVTLSLLKETSNNDNNLNQENTNFEATAEAETQSLPTNAQLNTVIQYPQQLTIVGVIDDTNDYIYTPQSVFEMMNFDQYVSAKVKVSQEEFIDEVRNIVIEEGFIVTSMSDTLAEINQIFSISQVVFTVVGIVALFVAAIGMFNTMTVSLLERTREIGIMKAIGATKKTISQLFLIESIAMGFFGGIFGVAFGWIFTKLLESILNVFASNFGGRALQIFYVPGWFYILVGILSVTIGFITGYFPAKRAAKLNPLDALRNE